MAIDNNYIQDLLERADIEQVISSYVTLRRAGKNLKGLCPFHNEKTPSFTVFPETKSYYCFGCQASGDAIGFIRSIENLDYVEAVKTLAQRFGMPLPEDNYDDTIPKMRRRILSANRDAAKFFVTCLHKPENRHALDYYLKRNLKPETITHFGLGYAPDSWHELTDYLKSLGYTESELIQANLSLRSEKKGNCYDVFRNRMMFPIIDLSGNVVAFSGRRYNDEDRQKYVNTADTLVFKKGSNIFGLNFAKNGSGRKLMIVEGQMDVIALHQAGFTNAVACLGTALTSSQAGILAKYADEVNICYDNDEAGRKATQKALDVLGKTGLNLKVIRMDGGKDPDEIIKQYGPERFRDIINGAANTTEYAINQAREKYRPDTDDGKSRFLKEVAYILSSKNPVEQDIYITRLSGEMKIREDSLRAQVKFSEKNYRKNLEIEKEKAESKALFESFSDKNNPQREQNLKAAKAEERLISLFASNPDFYKKNSDKISADDFITDFNRRLFKSVVKILQDGCVPAMSMFSADFSENEMGTIHRILNNTSGIANTLKECEDCITVIKNAKPRDNPDFKEISDNDWAQAFNTIKKQ